MFESLSKPSIGIEGSLQVMMLPRIAIQAYAGEALIAVTSFSPFV